MRDGTGMERERVQTNREQHQDARVPDQELQHQAVWRQGKRLGSRQPEGHKQGHIHMLG